MDLVLKGRRNRLSDQARARVVRKLARISRRAGPIDRIEVEVISEPKRRSGAAERVEVACRIPRRTFRAAGEGSDVEAALDVVIERLERQLSEYRKKRRARLIEGASRAKANANGSLGSRT
jgi:ribosomal subunit interface protein